MPFNTHRRVGGRFLGVNQFSTSGELFGPARSLRMDGVDEHVVIPHSSSLNLAGEMSAFVWVKTFDQTNNTGMLAKSNYTETKRCWGIETYNNGANLGIMLSSAGNPGSVAKFWVGSTKINDGAWHLVGFTLTASPFSLKLYVDGVEESVITKVTDLAFTDLNQDASTEVTIGSLLTGDNPALPIEGFLHRPIIVNTNIGASVSEIYNSGASFTNVSDLSFAANVVGCWKFSIADSLTAMKDESGNANHGVYVNGDGTDFRSLVPGTSFGLSFNGSDERIAIPHSASLNMSTGLTVFLYYKHTNASSEQVLISKADYGLNKRSWWIEKYFSDPTRLAVFLSDNGINNRKVYYTAAGQNDGGYASIAFTFGASTLLLYKNGIDIMASVTKASDTAMASVFQNTDVGVLIGGIYNSGVFALPWTGSADRVLIYNAALTPTQIADLHNTTFENGDVSTLDSWANRAGIWGLDAHNSFTDLSGNGNTGTAANMDASNRVWGVY